MERSAQAGPAANVVAWSVLLFLLLPITVIFPISLTDQRFLSLPYEGLSLQHYATFFTSERWLSSTWQSLVIAIASTILAVSTGTLCAIRLLEALNARDRARPRADAAADHRAIDRLRARHLSVLDQA